MNARRFILASVAALCAAVPLLSSPKPKADIRYAYGSTIDMQGGLAIMPYTVSGDVRNAAGAAPGGSFSVRYSYFIGRHFGISAAYSYDYMDQLNSGYFRVVNAADGGRYKYQSPNDRVLGSMNNSVIFSAVYRYDFGRWSLRPRLGIGFSGMTMSKYGYYSFDRSDLSKAPQYHEYTLSLRGDDYMMQPMKDTDSKLVFAAMASVQITYSVADHFFFSAEVGFKTMSTSKLCHMHKVYNTKSAYNPQNWAQAVYDYDDTGKYITSGDCVREVQSLLPASVVSFQIGIGWNIGMDRNKKKNL